MLAGLLALGLAIVLLYGFEWGGRAVQGVGCWTFLIVLHVTEVTLALSVAAIPGIPAAARRFWWLIAGGAAMFGVGGCAQLVTAVRDPDSPAVSTGSLPHVISLGIGAALIITAMLTSPLGLSGARERFRFWLDAATVLVGVAIFAWYFTDPAGGASSFHTLVKVLFGPAAFVVAAFGLVKLTLGRSAPFTPAAGALGCMAAIIESLAMGLTPTLLQADRVAWQLALGMLANVALTAGIRVQQVQVRTDAALLQPRRARPYSRLPYAAVAATYSLLVWVLADSRLDATAWVILAAAIGSTALVVVRQLASLADNADLLARLDIKVRELADAQTVLHRALDERDTLAAELRHLAYHDSLTGLGNRALFLERLDSALARGRRTGDRVTVLIIDLDDFKPVNDRFGHAAGDTVLREVAGRMAACVREVDTLARLGGDEFAILVERVSPEDLAYLVERVAQAVDRPIALESIDVAVRASVGVATADVGADLETLLHEADLAMYTAKEIGKRAAAASRNSLAAAAHWPPAAISGSTN